MIPEEMQAGTDGWGNRGSQIAVSALWETWQTVCVLRGDGGVAGTVFLLTVWPLSAADDLWSFPSRTHRPVTSREPTGQLRGP